jgi:muconate cycloisomerase
MMPVAAHGSNQPVKIVEVTAYHVRIPLRLRIRHASHRRTETDNLVVRCVLDNGVEGYGEGVPRDYVTGETIDSTIDLLRQSDLRSQFEPVADFTAVLALAERFRLQAIPGDDRGIQGNAARCALELALLDAYGKHFGAALGDATRLVAPDLYQPTSHVRYSGAITSARAYKVPLAALTFRIYRFRQVKVKVGIKGYDDLWRMRVLRRLLGRRVDLRIDANEAWSAAETVERIRELEQFNISAVEQPVPHAEADALAEVRRQVTTPIMLDESLCGLADAQHAVEKQTCDLFNIRLSKVGGFLPALRLAQFARRHGLGCQLGCQVGETAVLSAAGRHFATSVGGLRYFEGSYDRHLVREALATRDLTFGWGGWAPALAGPGLGIELDPRALERVTVRKEVIVG